MEICANPTYSDQLAHYGIVKRETLNEAYQAISKKNISEDEKQRKLFQVGYEFGGFCFFYYILHINLGSQKDCMYFIKHY